MQIFLLPRNKLYLVDVHTLGQDAFSYPSTSGTTLKGILEDENIQKALFRCSQRFRRFVCPLWRPPRRHPGYPAP